MTNPNISRFEFALEEIRRTFPWLAVEADFQHPEVDAIADIPTQPRVTMQISINLQNTDELHINAAGLWVLYFPCHRDEVFRGFLNAVIGLISGNYRVVEKFVFGIPVGAELQRPKAGGWEIVTGNIHLIPALIPWKRTRRILQNASPN